MVNAIPAPLPPKAQTVAELTFPEFFIVWALRQRQRHGDARDRYVPEFQRAFGETHLSPALDAFDAIVAITRVGPGNKPLTAQFDNERLSTFEQDMLAVLAALQKSDRSSAVVMADWMVARDASEAFVRHSERLAALMAAANYPLPVRGMTLAASPAEPPAAEPALRLRGTQEMADLIPAEMVLVAGFRTWVATLNKGEAPLAELEACFAKCGLDDGAGSLDCILYNLSVAATRKIDVRCRKCPTISPDEARLLHGVGWLQHGRSAPGLGILASWLPPAAVRMSFPALRGLANGFSRAGLRLPVRNWRFGAGADGHLIEPDPAAPAGEPSLPTIH